MLSKKNIIIILTISIFIGLLITSSYLLFIQDSEKGANNSDKTNQVEDNVSVEVSPNGNTGYIKVNDLGDYEKLKVIHSKGFCKSSEVGIISHCLVEGNYKIKQYKNDSDSGKVIKSGIVNEKFNAKGERKVPYEISSSFSENYYKHSDYLIDVSLLGPIQNKEFFDKVNVKATIRTPDSEYRNYKVNHSFGIFYRKFVNFDKEGRYKAIITAENSEEKIKLRKEYNFYIEKTPIIVSKQTEIPSINRGSSKNISLLFNGKNIFREENINLRFAEPFKEGNYYQPVKITESRNTKIKLNESETKSVNQTLNIPDTIEPGVYKMPVYISIDNDLRYSESILIRKIEFEVK